MKDGTQEIADVLQAFHDGTIDAIKQDGSDIELRIDCQYLAEIHRPDMLQFILRLTEVSSFEFRAWGVEEPITRFPDILTLEPETVNTRVEGDIVEIDSRTSQPGAPDSGGELMIRATGVQIWDDQRNEISPKELFALCKRYWDNFLVVTLPFLATGFYFWIGADLFDWQRRKNTEYSLHEGGLTEYCSFPRVTRNILPMEEIVDVWIEPHKGGWASIHVIERGPESTAFFDRFRGDKGILIARIKDAAEVQMMIRSRMAEPASIHIKT